MSDKSRLRSELRDKRRRLPAYRQALASRALTKRSLASIRAIRRASKMAFFLASDGETDLSPLIEWSLARDIDCFLPVVDKSGENRLHFCRYVPGSKMLRNRFGIAEPVTLGQQRRHYREMDIIFMPMVGFDKDGRRLGMGGGFYDRTLAGIRQTSRLRPLLVGVAHDVQRVTTLPEAHWDIHPDIIITPTRSIRRQS